MRSIWWCGLPTVLRVRTVVSPDNRRDDGVRRNAKEGIVDARNAITPTDAGPAAMTERAQTAGSPDSAASHPRLRVVIADDAYLIREFLTVLLGSSEEVELAA